MSKCTFEKLFVITATSNDLYGDGKKNKRFLSWQYLPFDGEEYFWATEKTFWDNLRKSPESNTDPHKYAFESEEAAQEVVEHLAVGILPHKYTIEPVLFRKQRTNNKN